MFKVPQMDRFRRIIYHHAYSQSKKIVGIKEFRVLRVIRGSIFCPHKAIHELHELHEQKAAGCAGGLVLLVCGFSLRDPGRPFIQRADQASEM